MEPSVSPGLAPPSLAGIRAARERLRSFVAPTPLQLNPQLSAAYECEVYLKREDLQQVRSYKIRGALNKISTLSKEVLERGVVCASAGNHAQGVAFACEHLRVKGTIFMPVTTPGQKVRKVRRIGGEWVHILLRGDTFDAAKKISLAHAEAEQMSFIHPFDDPRIIEGQGTIGLELLEAGAHPWDYIFIPIGGGGLAAGLSTGLGQLSPQTQLIGVEPKGAPSMSRSIQAGKIMELDAMDPFIDGAAVSRVGEYNFAACRTGLSRVLTIAEGRVCATLLELYNEEAIVVEPAGALSIAALDAMREQLKGKRVVCIVSGGNNDITRMADIRERAMLHTGIKHYFMVRFAQRAGALKEFLTDVLGPNDDITFFQYAKKNARETGPAVVGLELHSAEDLPPLLDRMARAGITYEYLNDRRSLFEFVI